MTARSSLLASSAALWLASFAPAQVVVSEINFSTNNPPGSQWIELVNLGTSTVDMSSWSLYYATQTPGQPNNYWFGFPAGTSLASGAYLRIHWREPVQASTATEIYTGNSVFNFLFGYDPEPLVRVAGALALLSTQDNQLVNQAAFFQDWISWGASGSRREDIAVVAGLWTAGQFVASPTRDDSIAFIDSAQAEPTPPSAFFRDATPTGVASNHPGAAAVSYGTNCNLGAVTAPSLTALSVPTQGNRDFGLTIRNTTSNESVFLLLGVAQATPPLFSLAGCPILVDVGQAIQVVGFNGQNGETSVPVSLLGPVMGRVFLQAITLASATDLGTSNGLDLTIGG